ncbi:FadD7 family fatty acid--CoA ligase [Rhodococcus koreensis]|uniref:FadD7 family fatty acid--CoA ligase n=1 Tax=Rhodococcus koreensis TaxID=99653 RepID=UPI003672297D
MADPSGGSVGESNRYRRPAISGLFDVLDQHVRDRPDARALVVTGDRIPVSYGALAAVVDDMAAHLGSTGLRRGDAVGLVCANTAEFVVALLGAARAGLVLAPMDPTLPRPQMSARLEGLGAQAILTGPPAVDAAPVAQFDIPTWELRVNIPVGGNATATLETGSGVVPHPPGTASELSDQDALVLFTSGSTNRAKMVPLTHTNVAASVRGICASYELGPEDATVAVMPLFHGHGLLAVLLASLASGGCVLLPERGRFAAHTFWDDMSAAAATWFTAVPTIHEILVQRSAREYPGPQAVPLRFVRSCSAPLTTATAQAMGRTFGAPVLSAYGMTETTHQATSEPLPRRGLAKLGSVGQATGVDLRVVDPGGHTCPAGTVGEVWVHGPTVARGYLADPTETAHSFIGGWFRTGDLGSLDEDGYLFVTGRIKNLVNRGGEKVSPEHVEAILAGCSGVTEAAVFAIPDATYGERVGAAVVAPRGGVGAEEILRHCRTLLAPFQIPDRVEVVTALPHTAKGALDRRAVRDQFAR